MVEPPVSLSVRGDAEDTAARWGDVTRLTCDLSRGSYNYLSLIVGEMNKSVEGGERRMTISRLVRGPIGSLIAEHKRVAQRRVDRRVKA